MGRAFGKKKYIVGQQETKNLGLSKENEGGKKKETQIGEKHKKDPSPRPPGKKLNKKKGGETNFPKKIASKNGGLRRNEREAAKTI